MVFKNSIYLFRTPLDPTYQNVYDDYNSEASYFSFLQKAFTDYKIINLPSITSRKNVGDNFEIVVKGYDSMDLHDYNYMRFVDGNGDKLYAFILSVESENDNQTLVDGVKQSACLLKCELDVWSNHYIQMKNSYNSVAEERCTLDTNIWRNYPSAVKENLLPEKVDYEAFLPVGSRAEHLDEPYDVIIPVWLRVLISEDLKLKSVVGSDTQTVTATNKTDFNGYNAIFYPAGIIAKTQYGIKYINNVRKITFKDLSRPSNPDRIIYQGGWVLPKITSSSVINSTLTVNVPFQYELDFMETDPNSSFTNLYHIDIKRSSPEQSFYWGTEVKTVQGATISDDANSPCLSFQEYISNTPYRKEFTFDPSPSLTYDSSVRYTTDEASFLLEQIAFEYPFNYKSICIGRNDIPIIGAPGQYVSNTNFVVTYDATKKIYAHLEFTGINDRTILFPLINTDEMPVQEIALDEYLQRNTGSLINQAVQGLFATVKANVMTNARAAASALNGNIGGVVSASAGKLLAPLNLVSSAVSIGTTVFDKWRTPSAYRQNGSNAYETPIPSDCPIVKYHIAYNPEKILEDYHNNGYVCFYTGSIFEKRRDCFDIDMGVLTAFSFALSNEDREKIISAVAGGICRWHIGDAYIQSNSARRNIIKSMNRKVFNYAITLIP